jgi:hypothetical protein
LFCRHKGISNLRYDAAVKRVREEMIRPDQDFRAGDDCRCRSCIV